VRAAPVLLALAALLAGAGCQRRPDNVPVIVSAIGGPATIADPARARLTMPQALMLSGMAQGLVRFDAGGQVEPGLAARWIVIDDGRSFIFRLGDARWSDGSEVQAGQVVAALRRAVASGSANRLRPHLAVIDEIVEMTPQVIEVRLRSPRPDLLTLFAQPEMAILDPARRMGTGPMVATADDGEGVLLRPAPDPLADADIVVPDPEPEEYVRLIGERPAMAIARFAERRSDLVSGGTFDDWPILLQARVAPANRRIDPAHGLFGLQVALREGFLATPDNREAVAMAIDRQALTAAFLPDWPIQESLLPEPFDAAGTPARPGWLAFDLAARRDAASVRVAQWRAANGGEAPAIRVALPDSPGGTLVWAHIAAGLRAIGLSPRRVAATDAAELRLVDRVAPYDSARWYLVNACQPCAESITETLLAARDAPDPAERGRLLADADAALTADHAFVPIARPLRWSLVALRLRAWRENARAWHPLNHLRRSPT
jgi:oligopeptide transport system substrate-binding protein